MRKLLLIMVLVLIPLVYGIEECQRTMLVTDIPCNIISSWKPSENCGDYNITIYNSSGVILQNLTWGNYTPVCNVTFNLTDRGTYYYNSTIENGIITVEGNNDMIFIIFIPLALCFLFIFWASTLDEQQEPLKWFMRLLSLVMIFLTFGAANIIINLNPGYEGLQVIFNFLVIQVIFYIVIGILFLYLISKIFMSFKNKSNDDFEAGVLK